MRFFLSFKKEMMMNYITKAVTNTQTVATVALLTVAQMTLADGFNEVTTIATNIRAGMYTLVGVLAGAVLLWTVFQIKTGRKTWSDFLETSLLTFVAGGAIVFATYLFTKGGSMSL